ncbi:MAG: hypothetical protein SVX43_16515, partial [Cyanobacteriota bacterium]|nr:hypothetical protein [Cyanobacteriota bacterium]
MSEGSGCTSLKRESLYLEKLGSDAKIMVEIMRALVPVHPDICLVVVGDGPYLAEMKSLADGLPIVF